MKKSFNRIPGELGRSDRAHSFLSFFLSYRKHDCQAASSYAKMRTRFEVHGEMNN